MNELPGVHCLKPNGTFYVFPNITQTGLSSEQFAKKMLHEAEVALLPGTNFGGYGEGYVRLCYAIDEYRIQEGIARMKSVLQRIGKVSRYTSESISESVPY